MAYQRPELMDLRDAAYAAIEAIPGADARLRFAVLNALAVMTAGAADGLYGYQEWISKQILPDRAEKEFLDRYASLWLSGGRKQATGGAGLVTVSGTDGTVVPAGTLFIRSDGVQYASQADATVATGTASVSVLATTAGLSTNAVMGQSLTLVTPVPGLQSTAAVGVAGLTTGTDVESDDDLRARLLQRLQQPPDGGSAADYVQWALSVAGVTRAWVAPLELGPNTVVVRFVRDDDASIIPDAAEVAAVQAYIDSVRPVTAEVTVVAPVAMAVNFQIQLTPNTVAVRAAVEAELRDLITREAIPGGTILLSHINEAISLAAGETDHVLTSPSANVAAPVGQLAVFGSITWM
ncbi:baseplate J-like protein [Cupriavidus necator N-1]|uniref:Baseplate J-like protein n=1 Tax=Cupriavidus necator (strain ATCC 43291 / DSM 13513 / CCUG 52238 / LMG 8453 / N-1) TaxID=1042878 RepID=G0ER40_CUPNN|nr:baseplate J/gp47 family protein [Cupriavidus necator]AEI76558.1 baseplate J-like protein [Cupriavidus necator N-1]MDX6011319.1 baseplate J/gp47 family protein [Cupriavidus necator]